MWPLFIWGRYIEEEKWAKIKKSLYISPTYIYLIAEIVDCVRVVTYVTIGRIKKVDSVKLDNFLTMDDFRV